MSLKLLPPVVLLILIISGSLRGEALSASTPSLIRTWNYGTPSGDDLAVDSAGNITIGGGIQNATEVGDALLLRYNASGILLLQRTWGGSNYEVATGVAVDASGNAYLTGRTSSFAGPFELFLVKFGPAGNLLWEKRWGDGLGGGATVDSEGDVIISGGGGLLKFNSSGTIVWQVAWMSNSSSGPSGRVVEDPAGAIYTVSDSSLFKFNSTGVLIWAKGWSDMSGGTFPADISLNASGDIYLTGIGPSSVYLLKLSQDGALLWQRRWEASGWIMMYAGVAANPTGVVYVTALRYIDVPTPRGYSRYYEPLILEYNSTGSLIGALAIQGGGIGELGRPSTDSSGSLYFTGTGTVAGASFCSPTGGLTMSSVSLTAAAGQVVTPSYSTMPASGTVGIPVGNETSQGGVILMKFDSGISGGSQTCSNPVAVFPLTLPMVTLMGLVVILQVRRRLHHSLKAGS